MTDEETDSSLSEDIPPAAAIVSKELIPDESKDQYDEVYHAFQTWREEQNISTSSEDVFLAYFHRLSNEYSPSVLWSTYSMLRATLNSYENVKIVEFSKIREFIEKNRENVTSKKRKLDPLFKKKATANALIKQPKTNVFTSDEVHRFLTEAPDDQWLAIKAVFVVGVFGACRSCELVDLSLKRVQRQGNVFLFEVNDSTTNVDRSFVIQGEQARIIEKYRALRPKNCDSEKFFIGYRKGKCVNQNIGKNTIGLYPSRIAQYLKLETPNSYTGHSYRLTAASLFADSKGAHCFGFEGWESECS